MQRTREISKSMMSYLKRAREHKEFLLKETVEFERGKRHLANMMGVEPNEMTQKDIDTAIKYLFPTGLFDKKAWPMMKHPETIFKAQKEAQFDVEGRPHHFLFYTIFPNYYEALGLLRDSVRQMDDIEDSNLAKGIIDTPDGSQYNVSGRTWLTYEELGDKFLESISQDDYTIFIDTLKRLVQHPYSNSIKDLLDDFSRELPGQSLELNLPEIIRDISTGQIYTSQSVRKHSTWLDVKIVLNGTGRIDIDGHDILFFKAPYFRRAILTPLQISDMIDRVDIEAKIVRSERFIGQGAVAYALRYALSTSIAAFVDTETRERLRLAGLLTIDLRYRERKKFGQKGARAKYTWKKR